MLMSSVVALSNFFSANFPDIFWYPNWYLGNPYQYLIGPAVPVLLTIFNFLHSTSSGQEFSIFNSYLVFIFTSFIIGAVGLYLFLKDWGVGKRQALISSLLYLLMPFSFLTLAYQNGLSHIAFGFFPFILLFYRRFLALHLEGVRVMILVGLTAFVLLIDISILLPIVVGFVSVLVILKKRGDWGYFLAKSILILLLALSIATVWYTPNFFWILLSNPSLGGIGLFNLIASLFKLLLNLLPVVLAVLAVKWRKFRPEGYLLFAVLFFSSFFFLSLVRFILDPDFVMDWSGFALQLQFGAAVIIGSVIFKFWNKHLTKIVFASSLLIVTWLNGYIISNLAIQPFNNGSDEYQSRIISLIKNNVGSDERIFFSGSPVFFINQYLDVMQVRGGADQGSTHPFWAHGAYQIREGEDSKLTHHWLSALGASYILVHQNNSEDIFHDFKNTQKYADFSKSFKLISAEKGDFLYKVEEVSIARLADKKILSAKKPLNGADSKALSYYVESFKKPIGYKFTKNQISVTSDISQNEIISLAFAFNPNFKLIKGQGRISKDSFGNTVIIPKAGQNQRFVLVYKENIWPHLLPLLLSAVMFVSLLKYHKIHPFVQKKLPSLKMADDDY